MSNELILHIKDIVIEGRSLNLQPRSFPFFPHEGETGKNGNAFYACTGIGSDKCFQGHFNK
jgi:hypothetical protein